MASAAYQQNYPQQQQYQQPQETDPQPNNDQPVYIDTQHDDMIHDAQLDYYGCKLATCSSGKYFLETKAKTNNDQTAQSESSMCQTEATPRVSQSKTKKPDQSGQ